MRLKVSSMSDKKVNCEINKPGVKANSTKKRRANKTQMNFSFALALTTLLLIFGYFIQSFMHIRDQGVLVITIDRLKDKVENPEPKD